MKRCKTCSAVISIEFDDALSGKEFESPKAVNVKSIKAGQCKECFEQQREQKGKGEDNANTTN